MSCLVQIPSPSVAFLTGDQLVHSWEIRVLVLGGFNPQADHYESVSVASIIPNKGLKNTHLPGPPGHRGVQWTSSLEVIRDVH